MDIRHITPDFAVSPQIEVADIPAIAEAGFKLIICNRPDSEVSPDLHAEQISAAAEQAGLKFEYVPVDHTSLDADNARRQRALMDAVDGPVLAYCRTGTRCSVIWAYGQAPGGDADDILAATAAAGYVLDHLSTPLTMLSRS